MYKNRKQNVLNMKLFFIKKENAISATCSKYLHTRLWQWCLYLLPDSCSSWDFQNAIRSLKSISCTPSKNASTHHKYMEQK